MQHRRKSKRATKGPQQTGSIEDAKNAALRLLRYRARSERELLARLQQKGWDADSAHQVVARFREVGLVDDAALAEAVVQSALADRKPHSRWEVRYKLRALGIPDDLVERALAVWTDEIERAMAERYLRRRLPSTPPTPRDLARAARAAVQKGFALDAVRDALRSCQTTPDEEL